MVCTFLSLLLKKSYSFFLCFVRTMSKTTVYGSPSSRWEDERPCERVKESQLTTAINCQIFKSVHLRPANSTDLDLNVATRVSVDDA